MLIAAEQVASVAIAQTPPAPPTPPTAPAQPANPPPAQTIRAQVTIDSLLTLIEIRPVEQIQRDLDETAAQKVAAESRIGTTRALQARSDTEIKVKETEIQSVSAQVDLAKKEKDGLKRADFEAKKKLAELEKQLLERRKALRDREIGYWSATRDYADVCRKTYELEMDLAQKRAQRAAIIGQAGSPVVYDQIRELERTMQEAERRTLDAQVAAADKRQKVAKQEAEVAKARKEIFNAQLKLKMGG